MANEEPLGGDNRTRTDFTARFLGVVLMAFSLVTGCHRGPAMVPVSGKVLYNGKPLEFGTVTFQPPHGQPARGDIQPDGTFTLSTYRLNDGAVLGKHKVRVACYESQRPGTVKAPGEASLGKLLIPSKYTFFEQSGLSAEIHEGENPPLVFELKGPPG
ncbi:MAG TPA: hypothetical protein VH107_04785 [Lacipirellulaceae bacterium]|nr:hypothetical protein [Lacipirellulaceae bacterium]